MSPTTKQSGITSRRSPPIRDKQSVEGQSDKAEVSADHLAPAKCVKLVTATVVVYPVKMLIAGMITAAIDKPRTV